MINLFFKIGPIRKSVLLVCLVSCLLMANPLLAQPSKEISPQRSESVV